MENKYYTPNIEEFKVGFRYEERLSFKTIFEPATFRKNTAQFRSILTKLKSVYMSGSTIRVKTLDQQDIEELGWKGYEINTWTIGNYKLTRSLGLISITLQGHSAFIGRLKNYNELKMIMKQLSITK